MKIIRKIGQIKSRKRIESMKTMKTMKMWVKLEIAIIAKALNSVVKGSHYLTEQKLATK